MDFSICTEGPGTRNGPRLCRRLLPQRGSDQGRRVPETAPWWYRPHRAAQGRAPAGRARRGEGAHLRGLRRSLHRFAQGRMAQRQARRPMDQYPDDVCLSRIRKTAGAGHRRRARHESPRADLVRSKPETAGRLRGQIEAVLDWATVRGYRKGENPARWRGHLDKLLPARSKIRKVEHHPALSYAEIAEFTEVLRAGLRRAPWSFLS